MSPRPAITVFGSSLTDPSSPDWAEAELLGRHISEAGFAVITGGYGGTMEAVSKGASAGGGHVIGVTAPALFPGRPGPNPHVDEEIPTDTLLQRIGTMLDRATGVIVLPGSIGTAAELMIAWNNNHIARGNGSRLTPTVAVGEAWKSIWGIMVSGTGANGHDVLIADDVAGGLEWLIQQAKIP